MWRHMEKGPSFLRAMNATCCSLCLRATPHPSRCDMMIDRPTYYQTVLTGYFLIMASGVRRVMSFISA